MKQLIDIIQEKLILSKIRHKHYEDEYFYFELTDNYADNTNMPYIMFEPTRGVELEYRINNDTHWSKMDMDLSGWCRTSKVYKKGDRIYFRGNNDIGDGNIGRFMRTGISYNVGGNIMSLIYGDNYQNKTTIERNDVFDGLFNNTNVVSAKELSLPAKLLSKYCYAQMFKDCEKMVDAPELPATKLVTGCYFNMFKGCILLKEITMLATDISEKDCLFDWVYNVSDTGTFIKSKGVKIQEGYSGIPKGWTVKDI